MKKINAYRYCFLPLLLLVLVACNPGGKRMNRRITLWRKDKNPYGTYFAYENLKYIFPDALISINKASPSNYYKFYASTANGGGVGYTNGKIAYIIIAPQVMPDQQEINAMMNFVGNGNQLFISSFHISDSLMESLRIKPANTFAFYSRMDSLRLSVYHPITGDSLLFQYPGARVDNYISSLDSEYTTILGRDAKGRPDFVKLGYKGGGAIYLHFAPLAFSNFFLLHKSNKAYYENVLSYLPQSVAEVKWDDYFRYSQRMNFSELRYILSNPGLRWAFWLTILLFLIIYLFESKRKQRMVPVIPPVSNSSLDFVKTIGRLYYQQKDNGNLAQKMTAHFLDHVRSRYNLSTSVLDEAFIDRLSYKSGVNRNELKEIVDNIKNFQEQPALTDEALMEFNKKTEAFYKQA